MVHSEVVETEHEWGKFKRGDLVENRYGNVYLVTSFDPHRLLVCLHLGNPSSTDVVGHVYTYTDRSQYRVTNKKVTLKNLPF